MDGRIRRRTSPRTSASGGRGRNVPRGRQGRRRTDNSTATYKVKPSDVPADAVTSCGSGLDPHISPQYAKLQAHRVAERNDLGVDRVEKLVADHTEERILGFMGEPRVNVLKLNIALKELTRK